LNLFGLLTEHGSIFWPTIQIHWILQPMQSEQVIREHLTLCEQTHALLLQENHHLKSEGTPPPDEILEKKRALLPLLDASLTALKSLRRENFSPFGDGPALIQKAQNKLMQVFYIDRENEQLLMKASMQDVTNSTKAQGLGSKITEIRDVQAQLVVRDRQSEN
jgi:hypothetical protein